ncbi:MAG: 4Fe-4S ferredoxin [Chloroflexota bacterium]|mgnify:FL=1
MGVTRRDFMKIAATSAAGAVVFAGCSIPEREFQIQSPVRIPEDVLAGGDAWYASVCRQCLAGCGIIVRVMEGRAKKIEGNPDHPLNRGKLCARGLAGVQLLYHPDRVARPLIRTGERGRAEFRSVSWDEALRELTQRLQNLVGQQAGNTVVIITGPLTGYRAEIVRRFARALGADHLQLATPDQTVVRAAQRRAFGSDFLVDFALEQANYVLSFGADFLGTWVSPVRYSRGYGDFRQGRPGTRGTLVHVDPRFSTTAANADEWLAVKPGSEGLLALSIAHVLVNENLANPAAIQALTAGAGPAAFNPFRPELVSDAVGVPPERIREVARAFGRTRPAVAIAGGVAGAHTNGTFNLVAAYALNYLVGSVGLGRPVRLVARPPYGDVPYTPNPATVSQWQALSSRLDTGRPRPVQLLILFDADPVYQLQYLGFEKVLGKAGYIVSFSTLLDDTAAYADLVLPAHTYLEDWGDEVTDPAPSYPVIGFQQPIVNPFYDSRSFFDVLLSLARAVGGRLQAELPWPNLREAIREGARQLHRSGRGSVQAVDFEAFWNGVLQRGGWWDTAAAVEAVPTPPSLPAQPPVARFQGDAREYPLVLIPFEPIGVASGGPLAGLPWLQAVPEPVTTLVWHTWAEVGPETARRLGLAEGDVVAVESPVGRIEVPVYVNLGMPPGVVAVPLGRGQRQYGRYAQGRGANVLGILAPLTDEDSGALAYAATRVRLVRTGRRARVVKFEGAVPPFGFEHERPVQVTRG